MRLVRVAPTTWINPDEVETLDWSDIEHCVTIKMASGVRVWARDFRFEGASTEETRAALVEGCVAALQERKAWRPHGD